MLDSISIVAGIFAGVFIFLIPILIEDVPWRAWSRRRQRRKERHLPIYERMARAEERRAEEYLDQGRTGRAREHYREAMNIRREATEAMLRGEEPTI